MDLPRFGVSLVNLDWWVILIPCAVIIGAVIWRLEKLIAAGKLPITWSDLNGWRSIATYCSKLIIFAIASFLFLILTLFIYHNILIVQSYIEPARHTVETPADFHFQLEPVQLLNEENFYLEGWLIEPKKPATVILLHGYGSDRRSMLWHAEQLAEAGIGVLLYDERASGMSQGDERSYGWQDPEDVIVALDYLASHHATEGNAIGIAGCSIGGQIGLQAASRDPRISAIWADGPAIVRAADLPPPMNWASALANLSRIFTDWALAAHLRMWPPSPLMDQILQITPRPIQFVAGGRDTDLMGAEAQVVGNFFDHAGPGTSLWVIESAVHCDGPKIVPAEYSNRLIDFFTHTLLQ